MRLLQIWARALVASIMLGAIAIIVASAAGASATIAARAESVIGVVIALLGATGGLLVVSMIVVTRVRARRLARAVASRRDASVVTPRELIEQVFMPLVECGAARNLAVALVLPDQDIVYHFSDDEKTLTTRLYEIGSLTKPMTAELLATMVMDGSVTLETKVGSILTDTLLPDSIARITLEELATHRSGLPRLPRSARLAAAAILSADPYRWLTDRVFLASLASARRTKPAGTYSNFGFALLARALGARDGAGYQRALQRRVLDHLGLRDTYVDPRGESARRVGHGHDLMGIPTPRWQSNGIVGAGGVCMTIADGARWISSHIDPPEGFREVVRMVTNPRAPFGTDRIGLGWLVRSVDGHGVAWHNGGTGGFSSFAAFDAARGVGVIAFTASFHTAALDRAGIALVGSAAERWGRSGGAASANRDDRSPSRPD